MAYGDGDRGVGGWLAFYLVTLGIIGPLLIAWGVARTFRDPNFAMVQQLYPTLLTTELAVAGLNVALRWFAVYRFLAVRNWTTVRIGIGIMWLLVLINIVILPFVDAQVMGIPYGTMLQLAGIPAMLGAVIYAGLWTAYLLNSARVDATYRQPYSAVEVDQVFD